MWLLNVTTFELEEYFNDTPRYAILSHRWVGKEELSFADVGDLKSVPCPKRCQKIISFCAVAQEAAYTHVWVDTCSIDKKSSTELSEAINSMYKWYERAEVCYVYLYDVTGMVDLDASSWFQRGWTLQELLAPREVLFLDRDWKPIGSRKSLATTIETITGISTKALQLFRPADHCIAEKFSWSARRRTTREEDRAYCLLGLFEVNMPLLYGEGERAFQRLQEEIMKVSTDMSLFLWQGRGCDTFGMLAADPSCYSIIPRDLDRVSDIAGKEDFSLHSGWTVNNAGISMEARVHPYMLTERFEKIFALDLNEPLPRPSGYHIFLRSDDYDTDREVPLFTRATVDGVAWTNGLTTLQKNYAPFETQIGQLILTRRPAVHVKTRGGTCGYTVTLELRNPVGCTAFQRPANDPYAQFRFWHLVQEVCSVPFKCSFTVDSRSASGLHGYVLLTLQGDVQILICLGLDSRFQPLCFVIPWCGQICGAGLAPQHVLSAMSWHQFGSYQSFESDIDMICGRGSDGQLDTGTDFGLSSYVNESAFHGKYAAKFAFDAQQFISHYLPTVGLPNISCINCISRYDLEKLRQIESNLQSKRLKRFHLPI